MAIAFLMKAGVLPTSETGSHLLTASGEELETMLHRYLLLYKQRLPQSALNSNTPLQAMKDCKAEIRAVQESALSPSGM